MAGRRKIAVGTVLGCLAGLCAMAWARPGGGGGGGDLRAAAPARSFSARASSPVIRLGGQSSGWHNRNFPSASARPQAATPARPSYGQGWSSAWGHGRSAPARPAASRASNARSGAGRYAQAGRPRPSAGSVRAVAGRRVAVVQHHHPYTAGYVRKKLRKAGVTSEPALITDRSEMLRTDAAHSGIAYPSKGPQGRAIRGRAITPVGADAARIRTQMNRVSAEGFLSGLQAQAGTENQRGRYYWHRGSGFNYCHYEDSSGYQWYGWYQGGGFFWTRNFAGRWWWCDSGEDRWCYYNNGFWWWQDPNHVGDLYCYDGGGYIPANSADDQILVSLPETSSDLAAFASPDGSRVVKLVAGGEDAFLYDTASPPSFDPVYLASGVTSVQFSAPGDGRPMEIMLKLDDGSFDLFDANGNPYNPGAYDSDAAAQAQAPAAEEGQ